MSRLTARSWLSSTSWCGFLSAGIAGCQSSVSKCSWLVCTRQDRHRPGRLPDTHGARSSRRHSPTLNDPPRASVRNPLSHPCKGGARGGEGRDPPVIRSTRPEQASATHFPTLAKGGPGGVKAAPASDPLDPPRPYGPRGKNSFNTSIASGDDAIRSLIASAMGPAHACLFTVSIASSSSSPPVGEVPPQAAVGGRRTGMESPQSVA